MSFVFVCPIDKAADDDDDIDSGDSSGISSSSNNNNNNNNENNNRDDKMNGGYSSTGMASRADPVVTAPFIYSQKVGIENYQRGKITCIARPTCGVSGDVWDFNIPATGDGSYINMRDIRVYGEAKVTKADGSDIAADENVAPVCNLGQSLFNRVETCLNNQTLPGATFSDLQYKGYVNTIMHGQKRSTNALQLQLFYPDTEGKFDIVGDRTNKGFAARQALVGESRTFAFTAPIVSDLLNSNNYLGPGNKLSIRLYRAKDSQVLTAVTASTFKLKVTDIRIEYTRIEADIKPPMIETHYFPQTEITKHPMAAGTTNINLRVQSGEKMPRHLYLFFVKTAAVNGSYPHNMLQFENIGLSSLNLRVNGASYPSEPLQPDFTNKKVTRELSHMFQNIGYDWTGNSGFVDRAKFLEGYTIFPFDLTGDKCDGTHIHDMPSGVIEIEAKCDNMLHATTAFVYMTWDMELAIDRSYGAGPFPYKLSYLSAPSQA